MLSPEIRPTRGTLLTTSRFEFTNTGVFKISTQKHGDFFSSSLGFLHFWGTWVKAGNRPNSITVTEIRFNDKLKCPARWFPRSRTDENAIPGESGSRSFDLRQQALRKYTRQAQRQGIDILKFRARLRSSGWREDEIQWACQQFEESGGLAE